MSLGEPELSTFGQTALESHLKRQRSFLRRRRRGLHLAETDGQSLQGHHHHSPGAPRRRLALEHLVEQDLEPEEVDLEERQEAEAEEPLLLAESLVAAAGVLAEVAVVQEPEEQPEEEEEEEVPALEAAEGLLLAEPADVPSEEARQEGPQKGPLAEEAPFPSEIFSFVLVWVAEGTEGQVRYFSRGQVRYFRP